MVQDAFFSISEWLKCITLCQRPPEKRVMWNQLKERERKSWGWGWQYRNPAGLWAGEEKRLNTLGRDNTYLQRSPGTTSKSRWDGFVQFHVRPCKQQPQPGSGNCCCFHDHSTHCLLMQFVGVFFFFFSTSETSPADFKSHFLFCRNMKALHYSALIPHGWRSLASLKSFPAACNINSRTKTKLISFSEMLLLTLNKVGGMGGNSSSNSLCGSRGITS